MSEVYRRIVRKMDELEHSDKLKSIIYGRRLEQMEEPRKTEAFKGIVAGNRSRWLKTESEDAILTVMHECILECFGEVGLSIDAVLATGINLNDRTEVDLTSRVIPRDAIRMDDGMYHIPEEEILRRLSGQYTLRLYTLDAEQKQTNHALRIQDKKLVEVSAGLPLSRGDDYAKAAEYAHSWFIAEVERMYPQSAEKCRQELVKEAKVSENRRKTKPREN